MASCSPFDVTFTGTAQQLFDKFVTLANGHGGKVTGDASGGTFSVDAPVFGTIAGTFKTSGQVMTMEVTKRSWLLSCSTIQKAVEDYLPKIEAADPAALV